MRTKVTLTRQKIDDLQKPSRELDRLVAEIADLPWPLYSLFEPSRKWDHAIEAAEAIKLFDEVVYPEDIKQFQPRQFVKKFLQKMGNAWSVREWTHSGSYAHEIGCAILPHESFANISIGATGPMAICQAILLSVLEQPTENS